MALTSPATGAAADVTVVSEQRVDPAVMELLRSLGKPLSGFLLISDNTWQADYSEAIELGVRAVLRRDEFTQQRLLEKIRLVADGHACFPTELQGGLLNHMSRIQRDILAPRGLAPSGLSAREIDVLRMAADGYSQAEIAEKMSYSERTIKNVFHGLMKRLHLRNRTHLVAYAVRAGLI
ncbi:response regulator transcription factor [Streptomyces sp. NPDC046915]|uniref:response regulator transcription factor n=1 Tax=Streptomyces sp. NPDC046915 TaxID=3155257 RepID=UPI00340729BA